MNREQLKELLPIIQAAVEGKAIEFRDSDYKHWQELTNPAFNLDVYKYRIKPEPKYRPFVNVEECWQEMLKHQPFGWIKNKKTKEYELLQRVAPKNGVIDQYACAFKRWFFADGTPFGIKEE